jgi:hypothetical protein
MFVLALVAAGKGGAALPEASHLAVSPAPFAPVDLPGCYPKAQGLLRALFLWYGMGGKRNTVAP